MSEFQVVIIATDKGIGNAKLGPIDDHLPHCLLPVANRPLISYQLELLEKAGFQTKNTPVLMLVSESSQGKIKQYVSEIYKGNIEVEFVVIKDEIGSCEMIYRIKDKIKSNYFIVMNGNLIVDDTFIRQMTDQHRAGDSSFTILLKPSTKPEVATQSGGKGKQAAVVEAPSTKQDNLFTDYIALDEKKEKIILMEPATEAEDNIIFNKTLLKNFPNLTIYNNLQDTQFYIFSRWVLELLVEDQKKQFPTFFDLKKQFIPYLISCQIPDNNKNLPASAINDTQELALTMSSTASPFNAFSQLNIQKKKIVKCLVYLFTNGYCINVNTIKSYQLANREIAKGDTPYLPFEPRSEKNYFIDPTAEVTPTQVGPNCIIGTSTKLGAKCSVKFSIIGKHCKIGDNVRIENSIIMDHVSIEDRCVINGSIICNDAFVKSGSQTIGAYLTK